MASNQNYDVFKINENDLKIVFKIECECFKILNNLVIYEENNRMVNEAGCGPTIKLNDEHFLHFVCLNIFQEMKIILKI